VIPSFGLLGACTATDDHDAARAVWDKNDEARDEQELTDLVDEELHLDAIPDSQSRQVGDASVGDESDEWAADPPYRRHCRIHRDKVCEIAGDRRRRSSGPGAGALRVFKRSRGPMITGCNAPAACIGDDDDRHLRAPRARGSAQCREPDRA